MRKKGFIYTCLFLQLVLLIFSLWCNLKADLDLLVRSSMSFGLFGLLLVFFLSCHLTDIQKLWLLVGSGLGSCDSCWCTRLAGLDGGVDGLLVVAAAVAVVDAPRC